VEHVNYRINTIRKCDYWGVKPRYPILWLHEGIIDNCIKFQVDCYGTVQPHTLIRQHLDYGHWYDRTKLSLKDIHNCQYVSCMNPTAGSFTINPRLQRHFCVIAVRYTKPWVLSNFIFIIFTKKTIYII